MKNFACKDSVFLCNFQISINKIGIKPDYEVKGEDEQLSNICKKHNIKMFDQTGFLVDRKLQLQTLQMMKEYILENIDKTYDVIKQYYLQKYKI